jgi:hypothetical protein
MNESDDCRLDFTDAHGLWTVGKPPGRDALGFPHTGYWLYLRLDIRQWCTEQGITYDIEQPDAGYWKGLMAGRQKRRHRCVIVFNRPEYKMMFLLRWKGVTG